MFCNNTDGLIKKTIQERNLDSENCDVHVGFDGGQGFLKIGFTVTERQNNIGHSKQV